MKKLVATVSVTIQEFDDETNETSKPVRELAGMVDHRLLADVHDNTENVARAADALVRSAFARWANKVGSA